MSQHSFYHFSPEYNCDTLQQSTLLDLDDSATALIFMPHLLLFLSFRLIFSKILQNQNLGEYSIIYHSNWTLSLKIFMKNGLKIRRVLESSVAVFNFL